MVETVFDCVWFLANILLLFALTDSCGFFCQALFLFSFGLGTIFVEEFEGLCGGISIKDVGELGNRRRDFKAQIENLLLTLEADVFWPSHHTRQIAPWLNILANTKIARTFFNKWILQVKAGLSISSHQKTKENYAEMAFILLEFTHLCRFLRRTTRLALRKWGGSGLLSRLWRLSLRKEDYQRIVFTKSYLL